MNMVDLTAAPIVRQAHFDYWDDLRWHRAKGNRFDFVAAWKQPSEYARMAVRHYHGGADDVRYVDHGGWL